MHLCHGIHLGYCTNIHRGESWEETLQALKDHTLRVKAEVAPQQPYGIGLRLSARAAAELSQPACLLAFQRWLEQNNCYIFTINGFHCQKRKQKLGSKNYQILWSNGGHYRPTTR